MRLSGNEREHLLQHIGRWVGPVEGLLSVPVTAGPPMELAHVGPTEHKPWHVWISVGASDYAMPVPEDESAPARAEYLLALPGDWPIDRLAETEIGWPLKLLAETAAFPATHERWLANGHSIPHGDPPSFYHPSTHYCASLIAPPLTCLPEFLRYQRNDGMPVAFHAVLPIYIAELELKLENGTNQLLARFDQAEVTELLDFQRRSVAGVLLDLMS